MIDLLHVPEWKWYQMTRADHGWRQSRGKQVVWNACLPLGRSERQLTKCSARQRRCSRPSSIHPSRPGDQDYYLGNRTVEGRTSGQVQQLLKTRVRKSVTDMIFDMVLFMIFRLIWIDPSGSWCVCVCVGRPAGRGLEPDEDLCGGDLSVYCSKQVRRNEWWWWEMLWTAFWVLSKARACGVACSLDQSCCCRRRRGSSCQLIVIG